MSVVVQTEPPAPASGPSVATPVAGHVHVVGSPNVGKSALFGSLTGRYATVSNYPGTSVEVTRGSLRLGPRMTEVVDTPGMYSLLPVSEEERVARDILMREQALAVLHVVDARNLDRMLPMTLQLLEAGLPVILVLNMMDEAARAGVTLDAERLSALIGAPVVPAVSISGLGVDRIRDILQRTPPAAGTRRLPYPESVAQALDRSEPLVPPGVAPRFRRRTVALLMLGGDAALLDECRRASPGKGEKLAQLIRAAASAASHPLAYQIAITQRQEADRIAAGVVRRTPSAPSFRERLSRALMNPWTGFPVLAAVLYFGLYGFVGRFGAGTVVDVLDRTVFGAHVEPILARAVERWVPWTVAQDLLTGDSGILTLGLRYALAIVLPIVALFFLLFAIIEDSGYLPRLSMLIDRAFKKIGLSGRAVIPMVLGLGCATMATVVTRTLPTRRERLLASLLLALAVPCSAQLGVILGLMEGHPGPLAVWGLVVLGVFLAVGYLGARLLPGSGPSFYMEIPPLRWPQPLNVLVKTYVRVKWYLWEILPLFLLASVLIWLGKLTGLFEGALAVLRVPVAACGLPAECAQVFLFGFLRRDYGAAGLYDLHRRNLLSPAQIAVASVALTLFIPCVAQFVVNIRERGWRMALAISALTVAVSFGVAFVLNQVLTAGGFLQ